MNRVPSELIAKYRKRRDYTAPKELFAGFGRQSFTVSIDKVFDDLLDTRTALAERDAALAAERKKVEKLREVIGPYKIMSTKVTRILTETASESEGGR